jgi:hypothetical protein
MLLALLPKCPLCVGSYLTALGLGGAQALDRIVWVMALLVALSLLNVWFVYRRFKRTRGFTSLALSIAGATSLIAGRVLWNVPAIAFTAAAAMMIASMLGSFPVMQWRRERG